MEVLEWIAKYWIEWVCLMISGGIVLATKHSIKVHKQIADQEWKEKEKNMCGKIINTIETEISRVETESKQEDVSIHAELDDIHSDIDNLKKDLERGQAINRSGLLSIQKKQFLAYCNELLEMDHYITVDEYEDFESEYATYKDLGGNHRGDALHDRVVDKVRVQMEKEAEERKNKKGDS